jgi:hypothetical protein
MAGNGMLVWLVGLEMQVITPRAAELARTPRRTVIPPE